MQSELRSKKLFIPAVSRKFCISFCNKSEEDRYSRILNTAIRYAKLSEEEKKTYDKAVAKFVRQYIVRSREVMATRFFELSDRQVTELFVEFLVHPQRGGGLATLGAVSMRELVYECFALDQGYSCLLYTSPSPRDS